MDLVKCLHQEFVKVVFSTYTLFSVPYFSKHGQLDTAERETLHNSDSRLVLRQWPISLWTFGAFVVCCATYLLYHCVQGTLGHLFHGKVIATYAHLVVSYLYLSRNAESSLTYSNDSRSRRRILVAICLGGNYIHVWPLRIEMCKY